MDDHEYIGVELISLQGVECWHFKQFLDGGLSFVNCPAYDGDTNYSGNTARWPAGSMKMLKRDKRFIMIKNGI